MDGFDRNLALSGAAAVILAVLAGCQVAAPIQVWAPPQLKSAVGRKVAIAPIAGDQKIAGPLHAAMIAHAPRDAGRQLHCIDTRALQDTQTIRLVSAVEGETSDIADLSLARRQGVDFLLTGEIIQQPGKTRMQMHKAQHSEALGTETPPYGESEMLAVSWKLVDVQQQGVSTGLPIVTRHVGAIESQSIAQVAAEDAWKLITPYVRSDSVNLSSPRWTLGSGRVRRGNAAAIQGDWMSAQDRWSQVIADNPKHHAALHNLSIAAVARQDYDQARQFIGAALKLSNQSLYRETAVWIETRQREYCDAFGLPDPASGWAATRR